MSGPRSFKLFKPEENQAIIGLMPATKEVTVTIRDVDGADELRAVEELQKEVWGVPDLEVVPTTHLVATQAAGGVLLGAFDDKTMVGFVYGFPALEQGESAHHSHMLAVKSDYRNLDLGKRLKLAQRERVLSQGITLMTWTFDPLQSLNAHFNFAKLGVVSDRYLINFYGEDASSFLHRTGTDRLWVKWLLDSKRVKERLERSVADSETGPAVPLVQLTGDESPRRNKVEEALSAPRAWIEIPGNITDLQERNSEIAREWREATRWAFTKALDAGYTVTEFQRLKRGDQTLGVYTLTT